MGCYLRKISLSVFAAAMLAAALLPGAAQAMQEPKPGMIERMKREGTYDSAEAFAKKLGNYKLQLPKRGTVESAKLDPRRIAEQIKDNLGRRFDSADGGRGVSALSGHDLDWTQLDLNHDRVIDERDLLVLGLPQPKGTAAFPSLGVVKTFSLLLEFEEYPHYFPKEEFEMNLFDNDGTGGTSYGSLRKYYHQASYNQMDCQGEVYGWHMASHPRSWYHADDSQDDPASWGRQSELVEEAILAADAAGADFSQYDNDGDGNVDYFLVIWTGPNGDWATFWWGYFGVSLPYDFVVDGVHFTSYSWQWENYHYFTDPPPTPDHWDPYVTIHETGHSLGLPDYYDYNGSVGPGGGCGGLDMMDGNWGDHNCFSKYWLGWLSPTIAFHNLDNQPLRNCEDFPDAVLFMPGFDPIAPWAEYYMAQNRRRTGVDYSYPTDGLVLWHIDSRVNEGGGFTHDNSYSDHKLIKLMQADGLEEIENGLAGANAGDFYNQGEELSPTSNPNSNRYDGSGTGASCTDISADDPTMTADFNLYTSNPPSVQITTPAADSNVSGLSMIGSNCSADAGLSKVQYIVDGQVVYTDTSGNGIANSQWQTLCEFNKPIDITVRAWDTQNNSSSATITVTPDNAGVTAISEGFETGMLNWRALDFPLITRGQFTHWETRNVPPGGGPPGPGKEAWVKPSSSEWCGAYDMLRGQRLNTQGYTRPLQFTFSYRGRGGFSVESSEDNGASWSTLFNVPESGNWTKYGAILPLQGKVLYLRFRYTGDVRVDDNDGLGANIDNIVIREAPSDPPTLSFTSPQDGDSIAGLTDFNVSAVDDGIVAHVRFYLNGGEVFDDVDVPFQYERDTIWDDNIPDLKVKALAEDNDGLFSEPVEITVALKNLRSYPVKDGLEADGWDGWSLNNDGLQPQWSKLTDTGHDSSNCLALLPDGTGWQTGNYEGLWYSGYPQDPGRRCIDLANPACIRPELSFWEKADWPSDGSLTIYFYNGWRGYQWVADLTSDEPEWARKVFDFSQFKGQSGELVFWHWGGQQTDGTGFWLDDLRLGEVAPALASLNPPSAFPGKEIDIEGSGFGIAVNDSRVFLNGTEIDPANYLQWSDTHLRVRMPQSATAGPVMVKVDQQVSNNLKFYLADPSLSLGGTESGRIYKPVDFIPLSFTYPVTPEKVSLYLDGELVSESVSAPFDSLILPIDGLHNGVHTIFAVSSRFGQTATSPSLSYEVFTFQGDADGDGVLGAGDVDALKPHIGETAADPAFRPWFDADLDGTVTEADVSYLGYNFGLTQ